MEKKRPTERVLQGRYKGITTGHRMAPQTLERFDDLIKTYDPYMSRTEAINKLIDWALKEFWLPGYQRMDRPRHATIEEREHEKFGPATPVYDGPNDTVKHA